jgi:hypothetical protein
MRLTDGSAPRPKPDSFRASHGPDDVGLWLTPPEAEREVTIRCGKSEGGRGRAVCAATIRFCCWTAQLAESRMAAKEYAAAQLSAVIAFSTGGPWP